jgi:hypothetical protein
MRQEPVVALALVYWSPDDQHPAATDCSCGLGAAALPSQLPEIAFSTRLSAYRRGLS